MDTLRIVSVVKHHGTIILVHAEDPHFARGMLCTFVCTNDLLTWCCLLDSGISVGVLFFVSLWFQFVTDGISIIAYAVCCQSILFSRLC